MVQKIGTHDTLLSTISLYFFGIDDAPI